MFNKVTAVVLFVQDFDTCLKFYRDTLELEVVQLEEKFAAFKMADQNFALQQVETSSEMFNVPLQSFKLQNGGVNPSMLCTTVDDVDAIYESLTAKGVTFVKPPVNQFWGIRAAYFQDPEGNFWEIAQPIASS